MEMTVFQVENSKVVAFERELINFDLDEALLSIREFDFITNFTFQDLNEEEEEMIESIIENL